MNVNSCVNCWYNGLQFEAIGICRGYCTRHNCVLNWAAHTTCGLLMRKDLSLGSAAAIQQQMTARYDTACPQSIYAPKRPPNGLVDSDVSQLVKDEVAAEVVDYGIEQSSIETLARLSKMPGIRAEVGLLSLGRAYIRNCAQRDRRWLSGLHLYRWTKRRLGELPTVVPQDVWSSCSTSGARQAELAQWSVLTLRIALIDDMREHATTADSDREAGRGLANLSSLLDMAAMAVGKADPKRLGKWMVRELSPMLDTALPPSQIDHLRLQLRTPPQ
ncbi:MAG: hypothetical protein HY902_17015 [Deltaproteobacteria bacterium]|nr:hypothetical protein [Deltaproteobacteria bacterium]